MRVGPGRRGRAKADCYGRMSTPYTESNLSQARGLAQVRHALHADVNYEMFSVRAHHARVTLEDMVSLVAPGTTSRVPLVLGRSGRRS